MKASAFRRHARVCSRCPHRDEEHGVDSSVRQGTFVVKSREHHRQRQRDQPLRNTRQTTVADARNSVVRQVARRNKHGNDIRPNFTQQLSGSLSRTCAIFIGVCVIPSHMFDNPPCSQEVTISDRPLPEEKLFAFVAAVCVVCQPAQSGHEGQNVKCGTEEGRSRGVCRVDRRSTAGKPESCRLDW